MEALIVLAVLVAFPLVWLGVTHLIAYVGGWHRLAELYQTTLPRDPDAQSFRFQSSRLGMTSYNGALRFDVQPDGLRMSVFAPFRPGHPPLLIPWDEIASIDHRNVLGFKRVSMTVGDPEVATLTLPRRVVESMRDMLPTADHAAPDGDTDAERLDAGMPATRRLRRTR